ncbi:hypothetical protein ACHQM5_019256 [Ranunculus cassubicifolius]
MSLVVSTPQFSPSLLFQDSKTTKMLVSAKAVKKLCEVLGDSLSPHHHGLLKSLLKEIPSRLWEGKEALLFAVAALCTSCHKAISLDDPTMPNAIIDVISSACSKKVKVYREAAFTCLQEVIKAFGNPEFFGKVFPLLHAICNQGAVTKSGKSLSSDAMKDDEKEEISAAPYDKVMECITSCIKVANLPDIFSQGENLIAVYLFAMSPGLSWTVKMSVFSSIKELSSKLNSQDISGADSLILEMFDSIAPKVVECISTVKIAQVHIAAAEGLLEIIKLYKGVANVEDKEIEFKQELVHLCEIEKNEVAKTLLKRCLEILDTLGPVDMDTA